MFDTTTALSEFRHRVANDLALVVALLDRRRRQLHVLSPGEILEEATNAVANLALLYRHLHDRTCGNDVVDVGRYLASVGARMDAGYLTGLGIALYVKAPAVLAPAAVAHNLALIVLELVSNAARHSKAARIGIELSLEGECWRCSVIDDGIGLPDDFGAPARGGLSYVGRIAASLDGDLAIVSGPQRGTSMTVCFPAPANTVSQPQVL